MTTPADVHGSIESLRQELAATNVLLAATIHELGVARVEATVRVEGLRAEQNAQRRRRMMAVAISGVGVIYVTDEHVEHCSPGARTASVFNASERGVKDRAVLRKLYDHPHGSAVCDATFPFHSHAADDWPTPVNDLGFAVMGAVAACVLAYHRWCSRRDRARVARATQVAQADTRP